MCCLCDSDDPDGKCGCFVELACALPRFVARRLRPDDGEGAVARQLHGQLVAERAQEMETESQIAREIARATILAETTAGSDQGHGNVYASWPEDGDRGGNVSEIAVEYAATPVIYPPTEPVRIYVCVHGFNLLPCVPSVPAEVL